MSQPFHPQPDTLQPSRTCLCTSVRMASRAIARQFDAALAPMQINSVQYSILRQISNHEPIAQVQLARRLEMERTTLYRALDILVRDDLIQTVSETDGSKSARLTSQGKALLKKARAKWELVREHYLEKLGAEKFALLNEALAAICKINGMNL